MLAFIHATDKNGQVTEKFMDISSLEGRQKFDTMFNFNESSIEDLNYEGGVARFEHTFDNAKFDVFVGENMMNVACVATFHLELKEPSHVH